MSTEDCWQEQAAARGPQLSFSKGSGHLHKLHSSLPARSISTWCYSADISDQRKRCYLHPQKNNFFVKT